MNHSSRPVVRFWHTIGDPFGSPPGGKPVWRTMYTRSPAVTGCHAMIDGRDDDHRTVAAFGPTSVDLQLRPALPPELVQSAADAVTDRKRAVTAERSASRSSWR